MYKAMNEVGKYRKISKAIKYDIFSKLEENMSLPSVRTLSQVYNVNPATIVKALHILKYQGIIYNKRTNGYYVCPNILEMREIFVKEIVSDFLQNMVAIGYSPSSILEMLREEGDNMGRY